jgi:hypothetical protein
LSAAVGRYITGDITTHHLGRSAVTAPYPDACEGYEATYSQRDGRPEDYVDLMRRIHEGLAQVADSVGVDPGLAKDVGDALRDARALQGAHRRLLIGLGEAIGAP